MSQEAPSETPTTSEEQQSAVGTQVGLLKTLLTALTHNFDGIYQQISDMLPISVVLHTAASPAAAVHVHSRLHAVDC